MAKEEPKGISLHPDDAVSGGGLFASTPTTVTFTEAICTMFDYNGKAPEAPTLKVVMVPTEGEDKEEYPHYVSAGSVESLAPSKDGKTFVPIKQGAAMSKSSNLYTFLESLKTAGFPFPDGFSDVTILEGLQCVVARKDAPKRAGLNRSPRKGKDGREYEDTVLFVDSIISLPGEGESGGGGQSGDSESGDDDLKQKAIAAVLGVITSDKAPKKGTEVTALVAAVYKSLKDDPDKSKVSTLIMNKEFMAEGPWEIDGTRVKAAG